MIRTRNHNRKFRRVPTMAVGCFVSWMILLGFAWCGRGTAVWTSAFAAVNCVTTRDSIRNGSLVLWSHRQPRNILCRPEAELLPPSTTSEIASHLIRSGICVDLTETDLRNGDYSSHSSEGLLLLARDFVDRPEVLSSLLINDFGFAVLAAHHTRALVMATLREERKANQKNNNVSSSGHTVEEPNQTIMNRQGVEKVDATNTLEGSQAPYSPQLSSVAGDCANEKRLDGIRGSSKEPIDASLTKDAKVELESNTQQKIYSDKALRSTTVNEQAKRRRRSVDEYNYGLPNDYANIYPKLASEMDDYYTFMTQPSTYSQESPIRDATAKVYLHHAKLFLGWCCHNTTISDGKDPGKDDGENTVDASSPEEMSIFSVLPNKEKESANNIIQFVLWMRTRAISVSYEANLLRGIIKLLKFRFAKESSSDPLEGKNTFDDIPIIKEVRKLHRDANQRQRLAPRSSDESKKWITWEDYLGVAQNTKKELIDLMEKYKALDPSERRYAKRDPDRLYSLEQVQVAEAYQRYLILAILASVPDRQRTIRELEVGRTLVKDPETGCWVVKHGPGDYKTGKHYGERPAMQLAEELTPAIDDFVEHWRPALQPSTNVLLVQSKTGKPMTSNSVFKRVVRCCFKYTGKSVNPHLLRDIIVTHVRETDASEKELEALALYMGHSIQMQRTSYDRRTLSTKVAPAVRLMKSVNKIDGS